MHKQNSMKKLVLIVLACVAGIGAQAQKFNIESALIELQRGNIVDAKNYIDEAAKNESTSNHVKMWYVKGEVYLAMAADETLSKQYPDCGVTALQSFMNCIKIDKEGRRRSYDEADEKMLQAVAPAYNYGINIFQEGSAVIENGDQTGGKAKISHAVDAWNVVLNAYDFDPNRQMETTMNLPKINILQLMADAAIKSGDNDRAFKLFNEVIASDNPVPYAYTRSALLHMELGDTAQALKVIEEGKVKFPDEKDLTTLQLMVYQSQGKEDLLTDKITEALALDPENPTLLANRANLYDNRARAAFDNLKKELEEAYKLSSAVRKEPNMTKKKALQAKVDSANQRVNTILAKIQNLDSLAIADYTKSYEIAPDQFDVVFNLGAVYFNGTLPLVEIANNLPGDANYEKNYAKLKTEWTKLFEDALVWFLKAEELEPDNDSVLQSIQQTYAQLGNQEKSMEYRDKRKQ